MNRSKGTTNTDRARATSFDIVQECSHIVLRPWLAAQDPAASGVRITMLDPAAPCMRALTDPAVQLPNARSVLDKCDAEKLANKAIDDVRRRVQQETSGNRSRAGRVAGLLPPRPVPDRPGEAINSESGAVDRAARCFRGLDHFRTRMLLNVADLTERAAIPVGCPVPTSILAAGASVAETRHVPDPDPSQPSGGRAVTRNATRLIGSDACGRCVASGCQRTKVAGA